MEERHAFRDILRGGKHCFLPKVDIGHFLLGSLSYASPLEICFHIFCSALESPQPTNWNSKNVIMPQSWTRGFRRSGQILWKRHSTGDNHKVSPKFKINGLLPGSRSSPFYLLAQVEEDHKSMIIDHKSMSAGESLSLKHFSHFSLLHSSIPSAPGGRAC